MNVGLKEKKNVKIHLYPYSRNGTKYYNGRIYVKGKMFTYHLCKEKIFNTKGEGYWKDRILKRFLLDNKVPYLFIDENLKIYK